MPEPLNPLERHVYEYLIDFLAENTYQPSIRDIASRFRIKSTKTVSDLLHNLAQKGYIERDQPRSRGVRIIGYAAGSAIQPVRDASAGDAPAHITMDRRFVPSESALFCRVQAPALPSQAILPGDRVLVGPAGELRSGDVVVLRTSGDGFVAGVVAGAAGDEVVQDDAGTVLGRPAGELLVGRVEGVFRFEDKRPAATSVMVPEAASSLPA